MKVLEDNESILEYLRKRNLIKKYLKARRLVEQDQLRAVDL